MSAAYEQVPQSHHRVDREEERVTGADPVLARVGGSSVVLVGLLTILISAWGGIVPFIGPAFGFGATGTASWQWNLSHAVLAVVPGGAGVVAGLWMMGAGARLSHGIGRFAIALSGVLAVLAGAWFAIGPMAWRVLTTGRSYFVAASPFHTLMDQLGYAIGTGVILAVFGAFAIGWTTRHRYLAPAAREIHTTRGETVLTSVPAGEPPEIAL